MASELRALFLLPFAVGALAITFVFQQQFQAARAADQAPPVDAPDGRRSFESWPKSERLPEPDPGYLVAHVKPGHEVAVHSGPEGRVLASLGSETEFGSAQALSVVRERRGRWLAVTTPQLPNGKLGWVDARSGAFRYSRAPVEVEIDLSRRQLLLRRAGEVIRKVPVSVGRPGSSTPTGRFAITDKLPGARYSSAYGCCILALSGTQPNLPAGWTGGNRLAIHGTDAPSLVGQAVSAGCPRARDHDMRGADETRAARHTGPDPCLNELRKKSPLPCV